MIEILIVEDNQYKLNKIIESISLISVDFHLEVARSFTSGWNKIISKEYALVLLDMSLPTYDQSESESGGKFRVFGGKELGRKMKKKSVPSKFAFITHYKNFSDDNINYSFDELKVELLHDYHGKCLDVIFYNNKSGEWRVQLESLLKGFDL